MAKEYEGFSKQDLLDRLDSLCSELLDNGKQRKVLTEEINKIDKLLEEMK